MIKAICSHLDSDLLDYAVLRSVRGLLSYSKVALSTRNELVVAVHKVDVILMKLATDFAML